MIQCKSSILGGNAISQVIILHRMIATFVTRATKS